MIAARMDDDESGVPLESPEAGDSAPDSQIRAEHLAALYSAADMQGTAPDLPAVLQVSIEIAVEAIGLDTGAIYTINKDVLYLGATTPALPPDFPLHLRYALLEDHPHIQQCVSTAALVHIRDAALAHLSADERSAYRARGLVTVLYVPLIADDAVLGVMILGTQNKRADLTDEVADVSRAMANGIAAAVANATP